MSLWVFGGWGMKQSQWSLAHPHSYAPATWRLNYTDESKQPVDFLRSFYLCPREAEISMPHFLCMSVCHCPLARTSVGYCTGGGRGCRGKSWWSVFSGNSPPKLASLLEFPASKEKQCYFYTHIPAQAYNSLDGYIWTKPYMKTSH